MVAGDFRDAVWQVLDQMRQAELQNLGCTRFTCKIQNEAPEQQAAKLAGPASGFNAHWLWKYALRRP